ncbi:MAG: hypothetical protein ACTSXU_00050 [Promethearchaeota archaeon]
MDKKIIGVIAAAAVAAVLASSFLIGPLLTPNDNNNNNNDDDNNNENDNSDNEEFLFTKTGALPTTIYDAYLLGTSFSSIFPTEASQISSSIQSSDPENIVIANYLIDNLYASENFLTEILYGNVNGKINNDNSSLYTSSVYDGSSRIGNMSLGYMPLLGYFHGRNVGYFNAEFSPSTEVGTNIFPGGKYMATCASYTTPLVLDIDGDGKLQASNGLWFPHANNWSANIKYFDINADGVKELVEWVGENDALLIDKPITSETELSGSDLFGTGDGWTLGFNKLAAFDNNSDSYLTGSELSDLYAWQDLNQDAITQPTEVKTMSALGITNISLSHVNLTSNFTMNGKIFSYWEWFPNFIEGISLNSSSALVPSISIGAIISTSPETPNVVNFTLNNWTTNASLDIAGAQLSLATDSGKLVLVMKETNATLEATGFHYKLVVLYYNNSIVVRKFSLPVSNVINIIPINNSETVIIIANHGTKILSMSLINGTYNVIYEYIKKTDAVGFKFGGLHFIENDTLYLYGTLFDNYSRFVQEAIISMPLLGGQMQVIIDLSTIRSLISGDTFSVSIQSEKYVYYVTAEINNIITINSIMNGSQQKIGEGSIFSGYWASKDKILFVLSNTTTNESHVIFQDLKTTSKTTITTGDFSYPMLSENGNRAMFARYNYSNLSMDYFTYDVDSSSSLKQLLTSVEIGPVRISPSGNFIAYQSSGMLKGIWLK